MIGKLFGAITAGSALASAGFLHRVLSSMATIMILAMVSALMIFAMLVSLFVMSYFFLVHAGFEPYIAGMIVGGAGWLIALCVSGVTFYQFRKLNNTPYHHLDKYREAMPNLEGLVASFITGFVNDKK